MWGAQISLRLGSSPGPGLQPPSLAPQEVGLALLQPQVPSRPWVLRATCGYGCLSALGFSVSGRLDLVRLVPKPDL